MRRAAMFCAILAWVASASADYIIDGDFESTTIQTPASNSTFTLGTDSLGVWYGWDVGT